MPANLKPAEDWETQVPWTIINPKPRIQIIRQIQADALRWAAEIVRSGRFLHDEAPDARLARSAAAAIDREANQLDPKPEGKDSVRPLNLLLGNKSSKCCSATFSIEGGLHGTHWLSCNACGEPCDTKP
jgi:hypothetical protein